MMDYLLPTPPDGPVVVVRTAIIYDPAGEYWQSRNRRHRLHWEALMAHAHPEGLRDYAPPESERLELAAQELDQVNKLAVYLLLRNSSVTVRQEIPSQELARMLRALADEESSRWPEIRAASVGLADAILAAAREVARG